MSTRFDAATDRISFAGAMFPVGSGFTVTAWAWVSANTATNATFGRLHASSGGATIVTWGTGADGLSGPNYFTAGGSVGNSTNMAVGAWRKVAISCSGTTGKSYVATIGGSTEVDSGTVGVGTPDGLTLGGRAPADSSEWFNGRLAHVRVWSVELTQAEIEAEWAAAVPQHAAGLFAWWPLTDSTDLTDHSGNHHDLTAGSTAVSTEADPPLNTSVVGTAAGVLGGVTGQANGVRTVTGGAGTALGAVSGTANGTRTVVGSAQADLGHLTGSASGTVTPGTPTGVTLDATDEVVTKAWIAQLPDFNADMVGEQLPRDRTLWAASGFFTVTVLGGSTLPEARFESPVMAVQSWAVEPGIDRPPWEKARQLIAMIQAGTYQPPGASGWRIELPQCGENAVVKTAYAISKPRRVYGDFGDYAGYVLNLVLNWVPVAKSTP